MHKALAILLFTASAAAQSFEQTTTIHLHESSMSARATAMGGASDALATDPSDLASNPALMAGAAGLSLSASAAQSGYGVPHFEFDGNQLSMVYDEKERRSFAHLSAVIPLRGFVLGLYTRNEPLLQEGSLAFTPGLGSYSTACSGDPSCQYGYVLGVNDFERKERRHGVTAAFQRGPFSLGVGAELQELDEQYVIGRTPILDPFPSRSDRVLRRTSGRALVPNVGARWTPSPRFALAAAYNGGAEREQHEDACNVSFFIARCTSEVVSLGSREIAGVDAYRASASWMPISRLVVTGEAVRRNYGKRAPDPTANFGRLLEGNSNRDVTELHAGAEFRLPGVPVSLRAGWWREPIRTSDDFFGPPHRDLDHHTYGAGIDLGRLRIDVGYDDAEAPALRRGVVAISYSR